ncbi:MAG: SufD family Fe-S cluster assembly protein [Candidatus Micrarchaeaceae archaeon]
MDKYYIFRDNALKLYKELPDELNELYKRYYLPVKLPELNSKKQSSIEEIKKRIRDIEEKTMIKFDVIFSDIYEISKVPSVEIKEMSFLGDELEKKIFKSEDNKLAAFMNGNAKKAVVIKNKKNDKKDLNMLFINCSDLAFQILFDLEENSKLNVSQIFTSCSDNENVSSVLQEFKVRKGAEMEINVINNCNDKTTFIHLSKGIADENAKLNANFVYNGSCFTKSINYLDANGENSSVDATEMIYGAIKQEFDVNTYLVNVKKHTSTHLETGVVLDGESRCVLKGYAKVDKWTKGAFSRVNERGIIISEKAHIDALPDMSIDYSDEVSATHSAATSPIDKEALFYIISRGIEEKKARKMFISSFINKYISSIKNPRTKEVASSIVLNRLENDNYGIFDEVTPKNVWST